jgi:hypothetical protein
VSAEPRQIHLVVRGEYSDFRILGAFLDERLAQEAVDLINRDLDGHDEASVATHTVQTQPPMRRTYYMHDWQDGADYGLLALHDDWVFTEETEKLHVHTAIERRVSGGIGVERWDRVLVAGYDRERVERVFGETLARFKAEKVEREQAANR